jgi:two-component system response regulator (stage 0 sporulation protein F)
MREASLSGVLKPISLPAVAVPRRTEGLLPGLLIVEDDPSLRLLYQVEFEEEGYEVHVAASGEEAVGLFRRHPVNGVILDICLGDVSGLDVLRSLLEHRADLAVVLNTAYTTFKTDFASWSADHYVVKSSDLTELKLAVRDALQRRVDRGSGGRPKARYAKTA